jgi:hypothetical protein
MLRQRQSSSRPWLYAAAAFLAGVLFSYTLLPRGGQAVGVSWQELERRRVDNQQILDEGQMVIAASGKHKKKLRAVIGVQVKCHDARCHSNCPSSHPLLTIRPCTISFQDFPLQACSGCTQFLSLCYVRHPSLAIFIILFCRLATEPLHLPLPLYRQPKIKSVMPADWFS